MVVTTIRYDDVQDALCNRSTQITNLRGFIDENIDFFLRDLWQKYNDGLTQFRVLGGTAYRLVEINESDIIRISDLLQLPQRNAVRGQCWNRFDDVGCHTRSDAIAP